MGRGGRGGGPVGGRTRLLLELLPVALGLLFLAQGHLNMKQMTMVKISREVERGRVSERRSLLTSPSVLPQLPSPSELFHISDYFLKYLTMLKGISKVRTYEPFPSAPHWPLPSSSLDLNVELKDRDLDREYWSLEFCIERRRATVEEEGND